MRAIAGRSTARAVAEISLWLTLALGMTACGVAEDRQPNPHSMDLATQAAASIPIPSGAKINVTEASKKRYNLSIIYLYNSPYPIAAMGNDATNLIRALLRKLVEDGQKPHDQETEISVWALEIQPGQKGESGHQFDQSERYFIWALYYPLSDGIGYEECTEYSYQWRRGHCS